MASELVCTKGEHLESKDRLREENGRGTIYGVYMPGTKLDELCMQVFVLTRQATTIIL